MRRDHDDMTAEHFQTTLNAFQKRRPFHPYRVELVSGNRVRVDNPEALVIRGGVGVFVTAEGAPVIFDHEGVSQVIATPTDTQAACLASRECLTANSDHRPSHLRPEAY